MEKTEQHTHVSVHIGDDTRISWQEGGVTDALLNIDGHSQYIMIAIDTLKQAKSLHTATGKIVEYFKNVTK